MREDAVSFSLSYRRKAANILNVITGDNKWTLYVNYYHRCQWLKPGDSGVPTPKRELHPESYFCASGGAWKDRFIENVYQLIQQSQQTSTANN
uniref:DUF1653 domain-containing protein n=1 Tax=Caenorhabditis tropicalis TaxID=1561998 RepID=A0A1I7UTS5_9PELO